MTRIKNVAVWSADLGNTKPYTIAFKTVDEVRNVFILITLDNGIAGWGAGSPSEYVTGEYLEQTLAVLTEENLEFMIGRDIREFQQINAEFTQKFQQNPAARAAVDIALHDAFTTFLGVPLVRYLGQKIAVVADIEHHWDKERSRHISGSRRLWQAGFYHSQSKARQRHRRRHRKDCEIAGTFREKICDPDRRQPGLHHFPNH